MNHVVEKDSASADVAGELLKVPKIEHGLQLNIRALVAILDPVSFLSTRRQPLRKFWHPSELILCAFRIVLYGMVNTQILLSILYCTLYIL
jgi:hypothetical protein